ncbi:hypothetical protein [Nonomuraea sp. C10]|uniref:hypothetical protein n=1 Tax=Nonomuraea sp. C10 TaxID=2600577 RepID=UPI0011CD36D0|nr:hypothetical protein [Nonomuraea sp. C10]TXK41264.1 hypothetical protein FR742_18335 [Nonomuraea sp. C10]
MKPVYEVQVWREDDWWLARVTAAGDGADPAPLNALTQARTLTRIESMARDLIATILDAEQSTFDIETTYALPEDVGELLCEAKGARAWLDAAQDLWQERSTIAARALTEKGYSLRETATLLGLSHQRVDQLLRGNDDLGRSNVVAIEVRARGETGSFASRTRLEAPQDVDVVLVFRASPAMGGPETLAKDVTRTNIQERLRAAVNEWFSRMHQPGRP